MAYKKDIMPLLKELGYTWEDMQNFWDELKETNITVKRLSNSGINWNDMNISVIRNLPTQKQRDMEAAEQKRKDEEEARAREEQERKEKEYYEKHFEEIMVKKIDAEEKLSENEMCRLISDYEIYRDVGENRRWLRSVRSIVKLCGRTFEIDWEEGLTECQENEYYEQPYEVFNNKKIIVSNITEWTAKKPVSISKNKTVSKENVVSEIASLLQPNILYEIINTDDEIVIRRKGE